MTSESVPVLSTEELTTLRAEAEDEQGHPGKHGEWERLVLRLLATLNAEHDASAARIEALEKAVDELSYAIEYEDDATRIDVLKDVRAALTSEAHRG